MVKVRAVIDKVKFHWISRKNVEWTAVILRAVTDAENEITVNPYGSKDCTD